MLRFENNDIADLGVRSMLVGFRLRARFSRRIEVTHV